VQVVRLYCGTAGWSQGDVEVYKLVVDVKEKRRGKERQRCPTKMLAAHQIVLGLRCKDELWFESSAANQLSVSINEKSERN